MTAGDRSDDKFEKLRKQAEELVGGQPDGPAARATDYVSLIHELMIHQTELELQNDELLKTQSTLSSLEREYEELYEFAPCAYVTLDAAGAITRLNLSATKLLAHEKRFLLNTRFSRFVDAMCEDTFIDALKRSGESAQIQCVDLLLRPGKSDQVWGRASIEAERTETKSVRQWRMAIVDVTQQKAAEEAARKNEMHRHQALKMESLSTLAGGIAHEFNNILTIVLGYGALIAQENASPDLMRDYAGEIDKAGMRGKQIVHQLLSFSRTYEDEQIAIDPAPVIRESIKSARINIPADIEIRQQIADDLPPIHAHVAEIVQLLINLYGNAADAMTEKGGALCVEAVRESIDETAAIRIGGIRKGLYLRIVVRDTGSGMPAEVLERIFDPFFTTKPVGKGAGIGLSVVHGIVKRHSGAISVISNPGIGSEFVIRIPACSEKPATPAQTEAGMPEGNEMVFIVDDERAIVELECIRLQDLGYTVRGFTNPVEALAEIRSDPDACDILITDLSMPAMRGDALASAVRDLNRRIAVVIWSGYANDSVLDRLSSTAKVSAVLMKPVQLPDLARAVRTALDSRSRDS